MALLTHDRLVDDMAGVSRPHSRLPRLDLGIDWMPRWEEFRSSLRGAFVGPSPVGSEAVSGGEDLSVEWVRTYRPGAPLLAAMALEIAALWIITLPVWGFLPQPDASLPPIEVEMNWTVPADLREIVLVPHKPKNARASEKANAAKPDAARGADAFHPRQTILSVALKMTHPRQTLIQPNAPMQAPKIVQPMPNIVEWAAPRIQKPEIEYSVAKSAPQFRAARRRDVNAPQITDAARSAADLSLQKSEEVHIAPPAPIPSMARVAPRRSAKMEPGAAPQIAASTTSALGIAGAPPGEVHLAAPAPLPSNATISASARNRAARQTTAAPELAAPAGGIPGDLRRLVALSANPAPPAPENHIPAGNLAANVSISPDGKTPGTPGGAGNGPDGEKPSAAGGNGDSLPAAISVSPANSRPANAAGLHAGNISPAANLRAMIPAGEAATQPRTGPANVAALPPGAAPEKLLTGNVFTMHVSAPNLTSTRGSWTLSFAQLGVDARAATQPKGELAGPLPIHTIDPKYPPDTMNEHIDGEVVLYAIIRKDGSVDSVQLVLGLDPRLDKAAMDALAQWKFRPGARAGEPVDIEAVVHVPFEYRKMNY